MELWSQTALALNSVGHGPSLSLGLPGDLGLEPLPPVQVRAHYLPDLLCRGRKCFRVQTHIRVKKMLLNQTMVMAAQFCEHTKTSELCAHFERVNCMMCEFYLKKKKNPTQV